MAQRGSAQWKGDLKGGSGTFTAGDSLTGDYSFHSRFEDGPGANPEQLIAAAHAACFTMALSNQLAQGGNVPDSVTTDAKVTLERVDGTPTITRIDLVTTGAVPGVSEEEFRRQAEDAKQNCIISRALGAVEEVTLQAELTA